MVIGSADRAATSGEEAFSTTVGDVLEDFARWAWGAAAGDERVGGADGLSGKGKRGGAFLAGQEEGFGVGAEDD
jgi:hypothetical protein